MQDFNSTANLELLPALEAAKKQGAVLFWNHPGWRGNRSWYPQIDAAHKAGLIHDVEVINAGQLEPQTLPWIEDEKLTILYNTDVHQLVEYPTGQHRDSITLVIAKARDLAGIREALDAKRTLAWRNDELWGDGTLLREFVTASVTPRRAGDSLLISNRSAVPFLFTIQANGRTNRATIHALAESEVQMPGKGPYEIEFTNIHLTNGKNLTVSVDH